MYMGMLLKVPGRDVMSVEKVKYHLKRSLRQMILSYCSTSYD